MPPESRAARVNRATLCGSRSRCCHATSGNTAALQSEFAKAVAAPQTARASAKSCMIGADRVLQHLGTARQR
jgi:hypothetical protein